MKSNLNKISYRREKTAKKAEKEKEPARKKIAEHYENVESAEKPKLEDGYCIICGEKKKGYPIEEDILIKSLRRIKKIFGQEKKSNLVVCQECYPKYLKYRKDFESKIRIHLIVFAIFFVMLIVSSASKLASLAISIIFAAFFFFPLLFFYIPKLKAKPSDAEPANKQQ